MRLFYLIGQPGAGKTTLMAALTAGCSRRPVAKPFAHTYMTTPAGGEAIELGATKVTGFSGTDALSMAAQPLVLRWLERGCPYDLVLGEGDRLGTVSFIDAFLDMGHSLDLAVLDTPDVMADARCAQRGSRQNESWRTGRRTKVANVGAWAAEAAATGRHGDRLTVWTFPGQRPPSELVGLVAKAFPDSVGRLQPA